MATTPALPLDIWLLVFAYADDPNLLWSTCRNVSRFLRDCVDDFFRHGILQNTFIDLHYSDIHSRPGPLNGYIHIPMVFDRLSDDGLRAVFVQRAYKPIKQMECCYVWGSVRGWVPFIERHCQEMRKALPLILGKSQPSQEPPLWEREHARLRNWLDADGKKTYLLQLRNLTSIGRGDRPPHFIKVVDEVNDTELVDLVVDCESREVSFDWRQTYSAFFREQEFMNRALNRGKKQKKKRTYSEDIVAVTNVFLFDHLNTKMARAREKRLQAWTAKNKHRMSTEVRQWTEQSVGIEKERLRRALCFDNLQPVPEDRDVNEDIEIVPERLADDHPDLLFWPWSDDNGFFVRQPRKSCVIL
ncbi:uncharacterized protein BDR25DRAFT_302296 [Lindgomyces ingoldianus]|uniref:Uncharacterized protein n=1 Tax=Lindgomyces ingoldianus TaxID=673940 RepID=A0ACB6R292_9PLEO|nr:uncharacterized protein BDR25DRAFT_302296 [Lindgomyces ingoldianus]KAF2473368.1 hypothetical protein BDR25DRAFT_302296 [Lindgomyces ingoldianus]